ncbi:uncharacterized protein [Typha latifolia]|uniref:uncharacterized protein n=1 Tax=Typha latifolia TaxID=4733 RepID=UPI003C2E3D76
MFIHSSTPPSQASRRRGKKRTRLSPLLHAHFDHPIPPPQSPFVMLGGCSGVRGATCCSALLPRSEIFSLQPSVWKYLRGEKNQLLWHMETCQRLSFVQKKKLGSRWKDHVKDPNNTNFMGWSIEKKGVYRIKIVAASEPNCLVSTVNDEVHDRSSQHSSNSDSQVFQSPYDEPPELDNREKLRRMRISKANKGNVPWNKGRKHSLETLRRIRERTRIAMQDPKVKMKLVNLGHAQSEETRIKIAEGVREGWQRRREKLMVQEGCFFVWQNIIAEASRKGYAGEDELQWNSYKVLDEQLKREWLESVEKRKTMTRLAGSRRAPKPPEHRRKISEAIFAKWTDPEYRERVCTALSKYYNTPVGSERRQDRKPANRTPAKRDYIKKKLVETKRVTSETRNNKRKKGTTPSYKDPMASVKFEMIKKIRVQRAEAESKKRDATRRARLLIAEAEKAAKALEVAALTSPIAHASLLETRKLIAEAMWSIQGIESSQSIMQEDDDTSLSFAGKDCHMLTSEVTQNTKYETDEPPINGRHTLSSNDNNYTGFDFDKSSQQSLTNGAEMSRIPIRAENSTELMHHHLPPLLQPESMRSKDPTAAEMQMGHSTVNGSTTHIIDEGEEENSEIRNDGSSTSATKTKRKWICGKLVEVGEH